MAIFKLKRHCSNLSLLVEIGERLRRVKFSKSYKAVPGIYTTEDEELAKGIRKHPRFNILFYEEAEAPKVELEKKENLNPNETLGKESGEGIDGDGNGEHTEKDDNSDKVEDTKEEKKVTQESEEETNSNDVPETDSKEEVTEDNTTDGPLVINDEKYHAVSEVKKWLNTERQIPFSKMPNIPAVLQVCVEQMVQFTAFESKR